tara:strand:- start:55 stop:330 length:276 start_codon:yes stop_codon:yes gene_type:complete
MTNALSVTTQLTFVPLNDGLCVDVVTELKPLISSMIATEDVAFSDARPSLSTDLIKYVPVIAGTVAVFAGLDIFSASVTEFEYVAPLVALE